MSSITYCSATLKAGAWERKKFSKGTELKGKTVGVVGLGMIGTEVARRCQALDMKTIGFDPQLSEEKAAAAGITKVTLDQLYAQSDFITLHTPMNPATKNLINKDTLAKCKDGVFIINAARGGIVHEADVLAGLNVGRGSMMPRPVGGVRTCFSCVCDDCVTAAKLLFVRA